VTQSAFEVLDKWDTKSMNPTWQAKKAIDTGSRSPKTDRAEWAVEAIRRHAGPGARVLDVGAGRGMLVYALRRAGFDAHGIEPHAKAVAQGKEAFGFEMRLGGVYDIDGESWDAVAMTEVIEHLQWPERALAVLERVTPVIVLTTPAADDKDTLPDKGGATLRSCYHLREWSPSCLVDFIEGCSSFRCAEQIVHKGQREIRAVYKRA